MQHAVAIWGFFFVAQFLHSWLRASLIVGSPLNGIQTYEQYVKLRAPVLLIRYFLATLGLIWWAWHPDTFTVLAKYFGWNLSLNVQLNLVTAGAYGYFSDSLIDLLASKYPPLAREIPPSGGTIVTERTVESATTPESTTEKVTDKTTVISPEPKPLEKP